MKQSFAKYLESRNQLLEAITKDPIMTLHYEVQKYCKFSLLESHNMRPSQKISIKWKYHSVDEKPTALEITIPQTGNVPIAVTTESHNSEDLFKWLNSNARELKHVKL
jgi:hypothetical protein